MGRRSFGWMALTLGFTLALGAWAEDRNVVDTGAVADGKTDNTEAFQKALDAAAEAGGGTVVVPAGHYRFDGVLRIPGAVTLQGTFHAPPTDQREARPKLDGSVLLAYAGRGEPESAPFIQLAGSMATLSGFIVTYPAWSQEDVPPVPYPPTVFAEHNVNVAVLDCCFLYPYEAIHLENAGRFLVRNVYGYPSYRGLYVDGCYDIGRVENVHFWPFGVMYKHEDPFCLWVNTHGVAFEFARTDWQYVLNTFCFGYGVGYKFSETESGSCNGNFLGIGADSCRRAVLVEQSQVAGLLITNGEFVGRWGSQDSVCVEVAESSDDGKVSLNNCSFWGPIDRCILHESAQTQLTASACHFCSWDNTSAGVPAIDIARGRAILQGNTFGDGDLHVRAGPEVKSAVIMGNQAPCGLTVENLAGEVVQLVANEVNPVKWNDAARLHYRLDVGSPGDQPYIRRWFAKEKGGEWSEADATKRWSGVNSALLLPVRPNTAYSLEMEVYVPRFAVSAENGLYLGDTLLAGLPDTEGTAKVVASFTSGEEDEVRIALRVKGWRPGDLSESSRDDRTLGVAARSVTVKAEGAAGAQCFNANTGE